MSNKSKHQIPVPKEVFHTIFMDINSFQNKVHVDISYNYPYLLTIVYHKSRMLRLPGLDGYSTSDIKGL